MPVAFVNGFFTLGCAYSWMAIYPVELFPPSVRATAASFIFNAARLIAWVFPLAAGAILHSFGSIPHAAMTIGSIYLLGLAVPWFMPETRREPLPDGGRAPARIGRPCPTSSPPCCSGDSL